MLREDKTKSVHAKKAISRNVLVFLSFVCLIAVCIESFSPVVYASFSRNMSFGTTKVTYDELGKLLSKTHKFIEQTNADFNAQFNKEWVSVGDSSRSVKIDGPIQHDYLKTKGMPEIVSSLFCKFSSGLDSQGFSLIRLCRNPLNP